MNPTIMVKRHGGKSITLQPKARFGKDYYCQPGMNWPAMCAAPRRGPVAPEGHPARTACEAQFLEAPCPTVYGVCTGTGEQCPITFDPYYMIDGKNQNHPANKECDEAGWIKEDGHVVEGEIWRATAHGKGNVVACDKSKTVCGSLGINQ